MIVTLTPNPSLDRTVEVPRLVRGAVTRVGATHVEPAGKGVNVARALVLHGVKARAVLPVGGPEGVQLVALLGGPGAAIDTVTVPVTGVTRTNLSIVEPDGTTTKLNEPGPALSATEAAVLVTATLDAAATADWVVLSGSLPPGAPEDLYAFVVAPARAAGARVAVDSSGPAFAAAIAAGPDLVKPNREELAEAAGMTVRTLGDAVGAAQRLRACGARAVLVSLGPDGALLVDADGALHGESPSRVLSTVGAGDALLAGFLAAGAAGPTALAHALAWGAAAASLPGSRMPGPRDIDLGAVRLHATVDADRTLHTDPAPLQPAPHANKELSMSALITPDLVEIDLDAKDRHHATRLLGRRLAAAGRVTDLEGFLADVAAREAQMATGIEGGIGIPHARSAHVTAPTLGFARSATGVDWGAPDGPAHLIFLIAAPDGGGAEHMDILARLARKLINPTFKQSLRDATDAASVVAIIEEVVGR